MKKYQIDTEENKAFLEEIRNNLLSFGHKFPSPEGGSYYLGDNGEPWTDRPRETWITSRMAHVYSIGTFLGHEGSLALAEAAIRGLRTELKDDEHGGWYAGRTADGGIIPGKLCYAHAFVILAASSALTAGVPGADELLGEALSTYDKYFWDETEGLSSDTWNTEFTELSPYRGINANMHTVEAFLAAADVLKDEKYRKRAGRIIDRVIGWARANEWRIPEHYKSDWTPDMECSSDKPDDCFKPYGATPGHGIEWARLITQWAVSTFGDSEGRTSYLEAASKLYDRAVKDAWNVDGAPGLCYTTNWHGSPIVHDRMHWTLAEAINTSAVLFRIMGDSRYGRDYEAFMEYLDEYVLDHERGSWYHQLDRQNKVSGTVWPDLYHAVQAMLIPYNEAVGLSIITAVV